MLVEKPFERCDIAVVEQQRGGCLFWQGAALYCGRPNEPIVEGEKRVLSRYADEAPTRVCARNFHRRSSDVGAMLRKLDHLRGRDQARYELRGLQLDERRACEAHAIRN